MAMGALSDEMLMAYADGELDEPAARRIEMAMTADPRVGAEVVRYLRSRRLARAALSGPDQLEVPSALRDAVARQIAGFAATKVEPAPVRAEPAPDDSAPDDSAKVIAFPRRGATAPSWFRLAAAAVVAAVVSGSVVSLALRGSAGHPVGLALLDTPGLTGALDQIASGESKALADASLQVAASFTLPDNRLCRQFSLSDPAIHTEAVACRAADGWALRFATASAPPADGGEIKAAGGSEALDLFLGEIGAGEAMDPDAERTALAAAKAGR